MKVKQLIESLGGPERVIIQLEARRAVFGYWLKLKHTTEEEKKQANIQILKIDLHIAELKEMKRCEK